MQGRAQDSRFDGFRLAAARGALTGTLDPQRLPRLEDRVADRSGRVHWTIRGGTDAEGRAAITIAIDGDVPLTCQRCLGVLTQHVEQATLLLLARDDAELVSLDEASEHEVVVAREPLDPVTLVEDELLLTLPFAPRHEGDCAPPAGDATE
jgi:uncharacterized protein